MRVVACVFVFWAAAMPAWADARVTVLMDALRLPDLVETIRQEGLADAQTLNEDMLAGQGGSFWTAQVNGLYDAQKMQDVLFRGLLKGLDDSALDEAVAFFDSLRGQRIVELETAARAAMIDDVVQDAATVAYAALRAENDPHAALLGQFVQANDLLEQNVAVTMSTRFQFLLGLSDGGLVRQTEGAILADVWAAEGMLREEAHNWLTGYFLLAYAPLDTSDLEAYLAFYLSPAGQALNAALFSGSEAMFKDIAYGLGRAVALNAVGDDI